MQVNKINSNISFRENTLSREMNSEDAILMLRDPHAAVRFQQSQEYARMADSVDSNPLVALGYKLYRAFHLIAGNSEPQAENKHINAIV